MIINNYQSCAVSGSSLSPEKRIYFLGCFSLIIMPNHDILNWVFSGTPFIIWKQILALILAILSIKVLSAKRSILNGGTEKIRVVVFVLIFSVIFSAFASLVQGLSLYRIAYAIFAYIGFIGVLGFAVATMTLKKTASLLRFAAILGIVSSVGIIIDYFTAFFDFLPRSGGIGIEEQLSFGYLRRASFFFGASTTIFPFLSFSVFAAIILFLKRCVKNDVHYFNILFFLSPIALYFTGSRSQLLLILAFNMGLLIIVYTKLLHAKTLIIFMIIASSILFFSGKSIEYIEQSSLLSDRYNNIFSETQEGNEHRFSRWREGVELFENFDFQFLLGIGLGSSMGMVNDGKESTTHYESSLFQAFSEAGWLGLMLRFFPMLIALVTLLKYKGKYLVIKKMFYMWLLAYFLSVFSAPTAGAYHTQMVYFLVVAFAIKIENFLFSIGISSRDLDK